MIKVNLFFREIKHNDNNSTLLWKVKNNDSLTHDKCCKAFDCTLPSVIQKYQFFCPGVIEGLLSILGFFLLYVQWLAWYRYSNPGCWDCSQVCYLIQDFLPDLAAGRHTPVVPPPLGGGLLMFWWSFSSMRQCPLMPWRPQPPRISMRPSWTPPAS